MVGKPENEAIGKRIRARREAKGLTQEDLARKIDVRGQTVYRYESGAIRPSAEAMTALARVLGTTEAELLHGQDRRIVDDVDEPPGWQRFVELGLFDKYRELGLDEGQLEYARRARFRFGPPVGPEPYVAICEQLLREPVTKSAKEALEETRRK